MVWIRRCAVILHVATGAVRTGSVEIAIEVTGSAFQLCVGAGQGELRRVVIEGGRRPGCRRMARLAGSGYSCRGVVRIPGAVVVLGVATEAISAGSLEFAAEVTCGAFQGRVRAGQRESRKLQVIEFCRIPGVHAGMAGLAICGEARGLVVRHRRIRKCLRMTRVAVRGKSSELPDCRALVARIAFQRRVSSNQRKSIEVLARLL